MGKLPMFMNHIRPTIASYLVHPTLFLAWLIEATQETTFIDSKTKIIYSCLLKPRGFHVNQ